MLDDLITSTTEIDYENCCLHSDYEIVKQERVGSCIEYNSYGEEYTLVCYGTTCVCSDCGHTFYLDVEVEEYEY